MNQKTRMEVTVCDNLDLGATLITNYLKCFDKPSRIKI